MNRQINLENYRTRPQDLQAPRADSDKSTLRPGARDVSASTAIQDIHSHRCEERKLRLRHNLSPCELRFGAGFSSLARVGLFTQSDGPSLADTSVSVGLLLGKHILRLHGLFETQTVFSCVMNM